MSEQIWKTITIECPNCKEPIELYHDQIGVSEINCSFPGDEPVVTLFPVWCAKCASNICLSQDITDQIMKERIIETRIETEKEMSKEITISLTTEQAGEVRAFLAEGEYEGYCSTATHIEKQLAKQLKSKWEVEDAEPKGTWFGNSYAPLWGCLWETGGSSNFRTLLILYRWPVYPRSGRIGTFARIEFEQGSSTGSLGERNIRFPQKGCGALIKVIAGAHKNALLAGLNAFLEHLRKEEKNNE